MKTKILTLATAGMLVVSGMIYGFTSKKILAQKKGRLTVRKKTVH